ncbi:hypothetical protein [Glycomyces sp. YM15]|uniref:hypothetical protein n=1 Tax=Glycomyces sp. YM15 TaxID=2800446 RepID=UPI00196611AA|nr:hypothetical protein [Glycomyces sp. YM15]
MTWLREFWKATLIVVAVGVALMHTTGHACADGVCHTDALTVAAATTPHAADGHDGGGHEHPGGGMNPMQVCMAILSGLAIAVSLWAIRRFARLLADGRRETRPWSAAPDMPASLPPGGRLSHMELSVFRI